MQREPRVEEQGKGKHGAEKGEDQAGDLSRVTLISSTGSRGEERAGGRTGEALMACAVPMAVCTIVLLQSACLARLYGCCCPSILGARAPGTGPDDERWW